MLAVRGLTPAHTPAQLPVPRFDNEDDDFESFGDDDEVYLGPAPVVEDELALSDAERDAAMVISRRGCLPGCLCEDKERSERCLCFSKFGGCDSAICSCQECVLPAQRALVDPGDMIAIDDAVDIEDGGVPKRILEHMTDDDDGLVYFHVEWTDGDTTWEPAVSFYTPGDAREAGSWNLVWLVYIVEKDDELLSVKADVEALYP